METLLAGLRGVAEPTRLRLLALCREAELTVTELTQILGQSQPRVSRHLKLMVEAGLLERFPEGTWVFYRLARDGAGGRIAAALAQMLPPDDPQLVRDRQRLAEVKAERAAAAQAYFRANAARWNEIRSLYIDETEVEQAVARIAARQPYRALLDIGTGTGRMLTLLAPQAKTALGLDNSREMLALARAALDDANIKQAQVRLGDMYALAVADGAFDLVVLHQVLHFSDQPLRVIREAVRALEPGGRLMLVDFAPHELETLRKEHAHRRLGFSDDEIADWFKAAGLVLGQKDGARLAGNPLTVAIWTGHKSKKA